MTRRTFTAVSYASILGANDRIGLGYIGLGARGDRLHEAALSANTRTVAICDLMASYLDLAASKAASNPVRHHDYRRLLEQKDVDAVVIATPDHWHALMFIDACRAGKDVYIEKPLSLTIREGQRMVEASKGRVAQVGTQRRSAAVVREAVAFVQSGGIGQVTMARAFDNLNEWPIGIGAPPGEMPRPVSIGIAGSGLLRSVRTIAIEPGTTTAGSTTTLAVR
jgi:predicted dehydrogenase